MRILRSSAREECFSPGSYYTDGTRLLRILSEVQHGGLRGVEDCGSLTLLLASVEELEALGLRPVGAGRAAGPDPSDPL